MTKHIDIDLTKLPADQVGPAVAGALHAILAHATEDDAAVHLLGRPTASAATAAATKLDFISPKEN